MTNEQRKELINSRILNAIFESIKAKPLDDITADEIAASAKISKRTLYKYYSSKKEMYLAIIKSSFVELAQKTEDEIKKVTSDDPWEKIACIGREYMKFCLENTAKARLILNYDEMEYIKEFEKQVEDIKLYSNRFEPTQLIKEYYEYHKIIPPCDVGIISLYLWAEVVGMASLLLSKRQWIKEYYGLDEMSIIEDHMKLSKKILGESE